MELTISRFNWKRFWAFWRWLNETIIYACLAPFVLGSGAQIWGSGVYYK
jgi:hypothetical protein